ncbi:sel1 repeat family protein [Helicobacter didelphidarum]|uniref:beta-lactamase n=1 Tax=Helicobacter didelphidarum TaxID=2040648 RepID=A0A3D8IM37_9HELI|nr:tetratricopeptide repeat protein [Helicobacter didelphidarum]RDU66242.1 sel1 repeat family protein [Helicobacter didelphidarum]
MKQVIFCIGIFSFFSISYAEMYGSLNEEEWRYTYNFCMQNNANACDYLIDNGLTSAQNCYPNQCDTIGIIYTLAGRYSEALPYFERSCEFGNMASCGSVGDTYYFYLKDYFKAKEYYEKSCKQKNSASCYNLGFMYGSGEGVRQIVAKEDNFYRQACSGREPLGCYNLGVSYQNQTNVKNNYSIAKEYYGKACDYGYQAGCDRYREFNESGIK